MTLTTQDFCELFPKITEHTNNDEVGALLRLLKFESFDENEHIIKDNQKNDTLYFVMEGKLNSYIEDNERKITIGTIHPGEYIGEVSMLDGEPSTSSVITETPCTLYSLSRSSFKELEKEYPVISGKLLRSISSLLTNRLRSSDKLLFDGLASQKESYTEQKDDSIDSTRDWFVKIYHRLHHH